MKITYDTKALSKIITNFSILANVSMAFYDDNHQPLFTHSSADDFCSHIQCQKGIGICLNSDYQLIQKCVQSRSFEQHICHTGLCDLVMPVIKNTLIVGYIFIGRFRTSKTALTPPAEFSHLKELYAQTPFFSDEKLEALKDLLPRIFISTAIEIETNHTVQDITDYIKNHLHEKLNISFLCSMFHISKDSLYEAFRETYQSTVNEYISTCRLEKAKELLATTKQPIYQITDSVGFENSTYFCQLFKKKVGISPTQYRKDNS